MADLMPDLEDPPEHVAPGDKPTLLIHRQVPTNRVLARFRVHEPIGTDVNGNMLVYRAESIHQQGGGTSFAVKYAHEHSEREVWQTLIQQANKHAVVPDHPKLLNIRRPPFTHMGCFCVVFPLLNHGSIRSVMTSKFPNGFPEDCILVVLKEVLDAMIQVTGNYQSHKEVSVGHIFLNDDPPEVKLGFSATVFDYNPEQPPPPGSMPAASITQWAVAPEVYANNPNQPYPPRADIWLIGITAWEMACGGIKVPNRAALEAMAREINSTKRLPLGENTGRMQRMFRFLSLRSSNPTGRRISKRFQKMVAKCLAWNPAKRPTVTAIRQNKLFRGLDRDGKNLDYFFDQVRSA